MVLLLRPDKTGIRRANWPIHRNPALSTSESLTFESVIGCSRPLAAAADS